MSDTQKCEVWYQLGCGKLSVAGLFSTTTATCATATFNVRPSTSPPTCASEASSTSPWPTTSFATHRRASSVRSPRM
eukprot:4960096-Pleurochrysis_carterae.AAC.2